MPRRLQRPLFIVSFITPARLLTIDELGSKSVRNSVFDCHLSPGWRQMAIENTVSNDFLSTVVDSITVFDCRLSDVIMSRTKLQDIEDIVSG